MTVIFVKPTAARRFRSRDKFITGISSARLETGFRAGFGSLPPLNDDRQRIRKAFLPNRLADLLDRGFKSHARHRGEGAADRFDVVLTQDDLFRNIQRRFDPIGIDQFQNRNSRGDRLVIIEKLLRNEPVERPYSPFVR